MSKKILYTLIVFSTITVLTFFATAIKGLASKEKVNTLEGKVILVTNDKISIEDSSTQVYHFYTKDLIDVMALEGDTIVIEYIGVLDTNKDYQDVEITSYNLKRSAPTTSNSPKGIFSEYYQKAEEKLKTLSLDEKIGQLFLVRYTDNNTAISDLSKYYLGGFVFFERDFKDKTADEVKNMINNLQKNSKIPLLTAVDEEGGVVVRVSSNPNLRSTPFKSSKELYQEGGLPKIKEDTIEKSKLLKSLGLNVNLAPVVDVTTDPSAYMYSRSLGEDTEITSNYAKTVIEASKDSYVSYVLKHFPGYGNNVDTHSGVAFDTKSLEDLKTYDLPPFASGIKAGAEAILVSHNTINSIDSTMPASLSTEVHNLLRDDLGFTGIIMTDDIAMGALDSIDNTAVKAILAGNDIIITTDYTGSIRSVKEALDNSTLTTSLIDEHALNVLAWKYYKGLIIDNQK